MQFSSSRIASRCVGPEQALKSCSGIVFLARKVLFVLRLNRSGSQGCQFRRIRWRPMNAMESGTARGGGSSESEITSALDSLDIGTEGSGARAGKSSESEARGSGKHGIGKLGQSYGKLEHDERGKSGVTTSEIEVGKNSGTGKVGKSSVSATRKHELAGKTEVGKSSVEGAGKHNLDGRGEVGKSCVSAPGKHEVGKSTDAAGEQIISGKHEVGKSSGEGAGKTEVGKSSVQVAGKHELDAKGTVGKSHVTVSGKHEPDGQVIVGKTQSANPGKHELDEVGKSATTGHGKHDVVSNRGEVGKVAKAEHSLLETADVVGKIEGSRSVGKAQEGPPKTDSGERVETSGSADQRLSVARDRAAENENVSVTGSCRLDEQQLKESSQIRIHLGTKQFHSEKFNVDVTNLKLPEGAIFHRTAEVTDPSLREIFNVNLYLEHLRASQFGAVFLYSPALPSTHTLLSQNFHAFPPGTTCVAGSQLQGKGRAGNVWESPKGCLMFSFTIQMTSGRLLPFLQYVVSLAVIDGIAETCEANRVTKPTVQIKWPNDLYFGNVKIGGVLCTSTYSAKTFNIVVGVGLNVGNRTPTTCLDAIIQDMDPQAGNLKHEELLAKVMSRFEELNEVFSKQGFSPLQDVYYEHWLHSGQTVILKERDPKSSELVDIPVTIRGLTSTGYLLATDEHGEQYELHPDGNSFDFLRGLVRSKLSS